MTTFKETTKARVILLRNSLFMWATGRTPLTLDQVREMITELDHHLQQYDM